MGEAADDMFDAALREEEKRRLLLTACPCRERARWERDDDGLLECQVCGTTIDE